MRNLKAIFLIIGIIIIIIVVILYTHHGDDLPLRENVSSPAGLLLPEINSEGPVTVKVTPKNLSPSATSWDFEILLDTHSQSLENPDLINNSVLVDDVGNQFNPTFWEDLPTSEVEPPQEHHRQGVLKFKPISSKPNSIELKIRNIGEIDERVFKWEFR